MISDKWIFTQDDLAKEKRLFAAQMRRGRARAGLDRNYARYFDGEVHRVVTLPDQVERLRESLRGTARSAGLKLATHKDGDNALIVQVIGKREMA